MHSMLQCDTISTVAKSPCGTVLARQMCRITAYNGWVSWNIDLAVIHAHQPLGPPRQRDAGHACEHHCVQHLRLHTLLLRAQGHSRSPLYVRLLYVLRVTQRCAVKPGIAQEPTRTGTGNANKTSVSKPVWRRRQHIKPWQTPYKSTVPN